MLLDDGTIVTGTAPAAVNPSVEVCHETEPYCAAFRLGRRIVASVCLHREPGGRTLVLSPCGFVGSGSLSTVLAWVILSEVSGPRLYPEAIGTRLYIRPPTSIPTTAPLSSRVKKPRIPFMPPPVMMYSSPSPGSSPISSRG